MNLQIKMMKGCEDLVPKKAHEHDACFDVYSAENTVVPPKGSVIVGTGLYMNIPEGYEVVFRGRSGLAAKNGILAHMGTIDVGYLDECKVILFNLSDTPHVISRGDRIAQFKLQLVFHTGLEIVEEFNAVSRGGGLGSTGK